jgi:hypothetical protein
MKPNIAIFYINWMIAFSAIGLLLIGAWPRAETIRVAGPDGKSIFSQPELVQEFTRGNVPVFVYSDRW